MYHDGELDFAATCVGIVDETAVVDGSTIEPGDAVLGFASAGVHANGFTLVRSVLVDEDYEGPDLLAPTRLYLDVARRLAAARRASPTSPAAACSATSRAVPPGTAAELDWDSWERPPVFGWLARHIDEQELRRVFNLGIGWCAVVADPQPGELVIGRIEAA